MSISVEHISKSYGAVSALENISFQVSEGELFGLIGPDGAGKTTLFRILTTLILPDEGEAIVSGYDVISQYKEIRKRVGYMPGRFSLYQDLSVEENLNFFATIFGTTIEENYELIRDIYSQIEPFRTRRAGDLSGGMKQKLALSCALIHKPEVLFLDEPTTGVDPVSRKEFWDMLLRLQERGITILVSTPYMDEAALCDRIALIQDGKILDLDEPDNVAKKYPRPLFSVKSEKMHRLPGDLRKYPHQFSVYPFGETVHYSDERAEPDLSDLKAFMADKGHHKIEVERTEPSIEDTFIELANKRDVR